MTAVLELDWCDYPATANIQAAIDALPDETLTACYVYWMDDEKPENHATNIQANAQGLHPSWRVAIRRRLREAFARIGDANNTYTLDIHSHLLLFAGDMTFGDLPQACIDIHLIRLSGIGQKRDALTEPAEAKTPRERQEVEMQEVLEWIRSTWSSYLRRSARDQHMDTGDVLAQINAMLKRIEAVLARQHSR